jgi:hypothetical protein
VDFITGTAGIGHYTSFTNLLANGRLILKAVIQRPLAIGRHRAKGDIRNERRLLAKSGRKDEG